MSTTCRVDREALARELDPWAWDEEYGVTWSMRVRREHSLQLADKLMIKYDISERIEQESKQL